MSTRGRILQDSGDWMGAEKGDVRVSYEKLWSRAQVQNVVCSDWGAVCTGWRECWRGIPASLSFLSLFVWPCFRASMLFGKTILLDIRRSPQTLAYQVCELGRGSFWFTSSAMRVHFISSTDGKIRKRGRQSCVKVWLNQSVKKTWLCNYQCPCVSGSLNEHYKRASK